MVFDPIPDPIAAGWTKEGDQSYTASATSLRLNDVNNTGFVQFYLEDPAAFAGVIELNPIVLLDDSFTVDAEDSTGIHVSIDDGVREIRAAIFRTQGVGLRVALALESGYTFGFALPTAYVAFQIKRLADGSAVLAVAGQTPETVRWIDLAASSRPGRQTIEFGSDNRSGVAITDWFTLGLPSLPRKTSFASFTVDRLQLRVRT